MINWYKRQTPVMRGMIWLIVVLIIGIALRYETIWEECLKGFAYFSR